MSVPDELVEVAAAGLREFACTTRTAQPQRVHPVTVAKVVLSAVSEAGWVRTEEADAALRSITEVLAAERDEARAQAEALAEALEAAPSSRDHLMEQWWRRKARPALRAFRESKETGVVR